MNRQEYESLKSGDKLKVVSLDYTNVGDSNLEIDKVVLFLSFIDDCGMYLRVKCDGEIWSVSSKDVELVKEVVENDSTISSIEPEDLVNNPKHYATDPSGVECIQIKRKMSANAGDAWKYCWRVGKKWDDKQDLKKALWYINDAIEHNVPVWLDDGVDLETETLIQQVLKHREGWQYMFINAMYWSDLQEAKRAIEIGVNELTDVNKFNK